MFDLYPDLFGLQTQNDSIFTALRVADERNNYSARVSDDKFRAHKRLGCRFKVEVEINSKLLALRGETVIKLQLHILFFTAAHFVKPIPRHKYKCTRQCCPAHTGVATISFDRDS